MKKFLSLIMLFAFSVSSWAVSVPIEIETMAMGTLSIEIIPGVPSLNILEHTDMRFFDRKKFQVATFKVNAEDPDGFDITFTSETFDLGIIGDRAALVRYFCAAYVNNPKKNDRNDYQIIVTEGPGTLGDKIKLPKKVKDKKKFKPKAFELEFKTKGGPTSPTIDKFFNLLIDFKKKGKLTPGIYRDVLLLEIEDR